jgi:hypothetical protein
MSKKSKRKECLPLPPEQALSILEPMTVSERARAICQDINSGEMAIFAQRPEKVKIRVRSCTEHSHFNEWRYNPCGGWLPNQLELLCRK